MKNTQEKSLPEEEMSIDDLLNENFDSLISALEADSRGKENTLDHAENSINSKNTRRKSLSPAQQSLFFIHNLNPDSAAYTIFSAFKINGPLDTQKLKNAVLKLLDRHETLRMVFTVDEHGLVWQSPLEDTSGAYEFLVMSDTPDAVQSQLKEESQHCFDLSNAMPIRLKVFQLGTAEFIFSIALHHIIIDAFSLDILITDLCKIYNGEELNPLQLQFTDYIEQKKSRSSPDDYRHLVNASAQRLARVEPLDIATDFPRTSHVSASGDALTIHIDKDVSSLMYKLASEEQSTIFMVLCAAFSATLTRFTMQKEFALGTSFIDRGDHLLQGVIGHFVSMLVLQCDLTESPSLRTLVQRFKKTTITAMDEADAAFSDVVTALRITPDASRHPVFQVALSLFGEKNSADLTIFENCHIEQIAEQTAARFDIELLLRPHKDSITGTLVWKTDLFSKNTMASFSQTFQTLLRNAVQTPDRNIELINIAAKPLFPESQCKISPVFRLENQFRKISDQFGTKIAIECEDDSISYQALNTWSDAIADFLMTQGVKPQDLVGISYQRSIALIAAMMGVLKAGAAYIPLDPDYPPERLLMMVEDANLTICLGSTHSRPQNIYPELLNWHDICQFRDFKNIDQEQFTKLNLSVEDNAYILFTSGSTGRPKGVMVTHRNVSRLFESTKDWFEFSQKDTWSMFHSYAFDFSVWEIFGALLTGGRLVIVPHLVSRDPQAFIDLLRSRRVTMLSQTPSAFKQFSSTLFALKRIPSLQLRHIVFGGEALDINILQDWFAYFGDHIPQLTNMYGITETTVHVTYRPIQSKDIGQFYASPIGIPIPDLSLRLVDEHLNDVPVGAIGELLIGGEGVAKGYLGRDDLTTTKFVTNRDSPGKKNAYRSGDLARIGKNGELVYLRRVDQQVKIRGFRIELADIQMVLSKHPDVQAAEVVVHKNRENDDRILAYVVPKLGERQELTKDQLSGWMHTFDETYSQAECALDTPDFSGWNSSYDKQAIPKVEMASWLGETLERIKELKPHSVLEIGCGTGMILAGIAPYIERYFGFDPSHHVIDRLRGQVAEKSWSHVTLAVGSAHDVLALKCSTQAHELYDLVIINSVAQYFPSEEYLKDTLLQVSKLISPKGQIFIGDLRANSSLDTHHLSLALFDQGNTPIALSSLKKRLLLSKDREVELLIDPGTFEKMLSDRKAIAWPRLKYLDADNELSKFRYDVVITLDHGANHRSQELVLHNEDALLKPEKITELLDAHPTHWLVINGVINSRVKSEVLSYFAVEFLSSTDCRYADVTQLYQIGKTAQRHCASFWSESALNNPETLGKIFFVFAPVDTPCIDLKNIGISLPNTCSNPLALSKRLYLLPKLKQYLQDQLPQHMVPSAIIALSSFPLTPTGKLDRQGLPEPEIAIQFTSAKITQQLPKNTLEATICQFFKDLIGVPEVHPYDNFFAIGGHSLLAMQLIAKIKQETQVSVPLRVLFEDPTPEAMARFITKNDGQGHDQIVPLTGKFEDGSVCLSFGQLRLWLLDLVQGPSATYNMPQAIRLLGNVDVNYLRKALVSLFERHHSLRTVMQKDALGQPKGWLLQTPNASQVLKYQDFSTIATTKISAQVQSEIDHEIAIPFLLDIDYALRTLLIKINHQNFILVMTLHHHVGDAKSLQLIAHEFSENYASLIENRPAKLKPLTAQYYDWAFWQKSSVNAGLNEKITRAIDRFNTAPDCLTLPLDYSRNSDRKRQAGIVAIQVSLKTTTELKKIAAFHKTTLFSILLGIYGLFLYRLSGQHTIVIGTAVSGRNNIASENLVGFLINTIAIPLTFHQDLEMHSLFELAKHQVENALADQDVPFEKVIEALNLERSLAHTPLFQAMFAFQESADIELSLPHLQISSEPIAVPIAKTDITLHFSVTKSEQLMGAFEYDADLFAHQSVLQWTEILIQLLDQIANNTAVSINRLHLLNHQASDLVRRSSHGPYFDKNDDAPNLVELFQTSLRCAPKAIAILSEDTSYTYEYLDRISSILAKNIQASIHGVENIIAVLLDRSPECIVSLLAIMKTGNIYLPISPEYPIERIRNVLLNSQATLVITEDTIDKKTIEKITGNNSKLEIFNLTNHAQYCKDLKNIALYESHAFNPPSVIHPENLAYIIYTSGSTGMPKGVAIPHGGAVNMARAKTIAFNIDPGDRVLQFASLAFDGSIQEIFSAFYAQATLILPSKEMRMDTAYSLPDYIQQYAVTHATLPPSLLETLDVDGLKSLKNLAVAGEACPMPIAKKYSAAIRLVNAYGPTEVTVCATISKPLNFSQLKASQYTNAPIGFPIANVQTYVLDPSLNLLPNGQVGELYVSGIGVARGYYKNPKLTAQSFLPCPFASTDGQNLGQRMYKTGDLVKRHPDGNLEFISRIDQQVKLRGYRIELGEIASTLTTLFSDRMSQVVVHPQCIAKETRIIAYYCLKENAPALSQEDITSELALHLPEYMIPFACIELAKLPLTSNGKINFKSLPLPEIDRHNSNYVEPITPLECLICDIFSEITGAKKIGLKDNFFDLGGHSLSAIKLVSKLFASTGKEIPVRIMFTHPSPERLANYINSTSLQQTALAKVIPLQILGTNIPVFCIHPAGGYGSVYKNLAQALGQNQPVWALQARGLEDGEQPDASFSDMANNYVKTILEIQPQGPYRLLGWSIGGVIAQEMAFILEQMGHRTVQLVLLDSPAHPIKTSHVDINVILYELIKEHMESDLLTFPLDQIPESFADRLHLAKKIMLSHGHISEDTPLSWIERSLQQFALSVTRLNQHLFKKCSTPILFFSAQDNLNGSAHEWSLYTASDVDIVKLDSIHAHMVDEKHSHVVAQHIMRHFNHRNTDAHS